MPVLIEPEHSATPAPVAAQGRTGSSVAPTHTAASPRRVRRTVGALSAALLVLVGPVLASVITAAPAAAASVPGPVYAWGDNSFGELGNGTTTDSLAPVESQLPGGVTATAVSAGFDYSLALTSTGSVYGWGENGSGQLGNGTTSGGETPVEVELPVGVTATAVAAGLNTSFALTSTGTLYAWGENFGAFGNGTTANSDVPVAITLPDSLTATAIAVGNDFAFALTSTGAVYAWGTNGQGQLGNGTTTSSDTPVEVSLPGGVIATGIAAGQAFGLAVTSTGAVYDWGFMGEAEACGGVPGTPQCPTPPNWLDTDSPTKVALPGGVIATAVAGGVADALAVTSTGAAYAWGDNENAQLGNGTLTSSATPVAVDLPEGVMASAVGVGGQFSVLLTTSGSVYSWGFDGYDELGYDVAGAQPNAFTPEQVPQPGGAPVSAISAGEYHTVALVGPSSQTIHFTSTAPTGPIPGTTYTVSATATSGLAVTFSIAAASSAICAIENRDVVAFAQAGTCTIDADQAGNTNFSAAPEASQPVTVSAAPTAPGVVFGWGGNGDGQLANSSLASAGSDVPVLADLPPGMTVTQVSASGQDGLALTSSGAVYAWGSNDADQLGNAMMTVSATPVLVPISLPEGVTITQISSGGENAMALASNGSIYAWGDNQQGELGIGSEGNVVPSPTLVPLPGGAKATSIEAGTTGIALTTAGAVYTWGLSGDGQLGNGTISTTGCDCTDTPGLVQLPGGVVATAVSLGVYDGYAVTSTGAVYAWGFNGDGELGIGSVTPSVTGTPTLVQLPGGVTASAVSSSVYDAMALSTTGAVYTWGEGQFGQLGNGTDSDFSDLPVLAQLPGGTTASAIASSAFNGVALTTTGAVYAWGSNASGELGNGTTTSSSTPVEVDLPSGSIATAITASSYDAYAVVNDVPQSITFTSTPPASAAVGGVYSVVASASSNLAVSLSIPAASASVCTLSGTTVTFVGAGTCTIDANQAGTSVFSAAAQVSQSVSVAGASNAFGSVYATGTNLYGQLGDGTTTNSSALVLSQLPAGADVTAVSGGAFDSLALTSTGQVYAWGQGDSGELGNGATSSSDVPVLVQFPGGVVITAISAGADDANLALTSTGTVYAWGDGATGQIGNGSTSSSDVPVVVSLPGGAVATGISAGATADLAVTSTGKVYAWGDNEYGGLGDGATLTTGCDCADSPVLVQLPGGVKATGVSMGAWFGTALTSTGTVYSWGIDVQGELGNGTTLSSTCSCDTTPSLVDLPGGVDATAVVAGANQAVVLTTSGAVYAWGLAAFGEMGDGGTGAASCECDDVPVKVNLPAGSSTVAISEGNDNSLAILSTGAVYSWGAGVLSPTQVSLPGGAAASAVAVGYNFELIVVGQQSQTIAFGSTPPASPIVGGTYTVSATATSDLPVTLAVDPTSASECSLIGSTVTFEKVGVCTIDATQAGNAAFGPAPQVSQVIVVGAQSQTITFSTTAPSSPVVGNTYPVAATATSGLTVSLTVDPSSTSVCSIQAGTVDLIGPGTCTIDANQAGSSSYGPAPQVQQAAVVGRTSQTISFSSTAPSGAVPGNTYAVAATSTSGLTVTFSIDASTSSVCSIAGATVSLHTTGNCLIDANQAGSATYAPAPQLQQSVAVGQDTQTISFTSTVPSSPVVGGTYPVTATATSGLPVSLSIDSSTTSVCTISGTTSGSTVTFDAVGTCTIDAAQSGNADYSAANPKSQSVTGIAPGSQTITFTSTPAAGSGVGGTYTVSATATSGLAVTFKIDGSSTVGACTISGATVTFTGSGTCVIDANQSGLPNYNPAPQVQQSFTVADVSASCTIEWTGGTGDWTTTVFWTTTGSSPTNRLPTSTDVTCIPAGSDVTLSSSDPAENSGNLLLGNVDGSGTAALQVNGTLRMQSGTIYPGGTLSVASTGSVTQTGTLTNTGNVSVTGTGSEVFEAAGTFANDTGGSITVNSAGAFLVSVGATFNQDGGTTSGSPVLIQDGNLNFDGGGAADFSVENDGSSDVDGVPYAGQILTIQAGEGITLNPGTGNTNAGTIELQPGSSTTTINNEGTFANTGTIEVDAGAANTFAQIENGTINSSGALVDNGGLTLTGTFTSTGSVSVGASGALTENGTFNNDAGGSITITTGGSFTTTDIFNEDGGTTSGLPVQVQDATLSFDGGGAADFSVKDDGTTDVNGVPYAGQILTIQAGEGISLNPGSGNTNAGTIELQPGSSTTTINNEGTFANTGTIEVDAGAANTFAQIENGTINSSGALVDNGGLTLTGTFTSTGSVSVGASGALTENGTFNNDAGGSITITTGGSFTTTDIFNEDGGTTSGLPVQVQDATLSFDGGGAADFSVKDDGTTDVNGVPYAGQILTIQAGEGISLNPGSGNTNAGTIELQPGSSTTTINNEGTFANTGTIEVDAAGTDTAQIENGTINSSGALVDNGDFNLTGTFTNTGSVSVGASGALIENGTFNNDAGGSITIATGGSFTTTDIFNEDGGTTSGTTSSTTPGAPVLIQDATLNFDGGGAADFSVKDDGTTDVAGLPYTGQTLTLQPGEGLNLNPGTNSGTIELEPGASTTVINNEGTFTNNGTIEVDAGASNTSAEIENGTINSPGVLVDNGDFTLTGTFTSTGSVSVGASGALTENGTFNNDAGGSITITTGGSFTTTDIFNEDGGTTSGLPVQVQDATLSFDGGGAADFSVKDDGTTDVNGVPYAGQILTIQAGEGISLNPGSGNTNAGTIELQPGSSTTTINNEGTFANTGTIEVDAAGTDTAQIENGTINSSGALVDNGDFNLTGTFTNTGSVSVGASGALIENGTFNNDAGGSITIATGGSFTTTDIFNEDGGTTSGTTSSTTPGAPVLIQDATLNFDGGGAADFSVKDDGTTDVAGVPYASQTLTIQPGEGIALNPGTGNTNAGTIQLEAGSAINNEGTFTNTGLIDAQVSASAGVSIENGKIINNGNVILETGNTTDITGTFTQGSAGTLTVDMGAATGFGNVISGPTTLAGTLVVNTDFTPTVGSIFTIVASSSLSTVFSTYVFNGYADYSVEYGSNDVKLAVTSGEASTALSTVTASPTSVTANGSTVSTITVTLEDDLGNPVEGKAVSLASSSSTSVIDVLNGTTNSAGVATFSVTDTVAEPVTYTATDTSDGLILTETPQVTFTPGPVSTTTSTTTASPPTLTADGVGASTVTVTLEDAEGNPVPGQTVMLAANSSNTVITTLFGVTNAEGQAVFLVTDIVAETVTYTPAVSGVSGLESAQVVFTSGPPSAMTSTVTASPVSVTDNGSASSTITVTVEDDNGNPVSGQTVTIGQGTGGSLITPVDGGITNAEGVATFTAVDSTSQEVTYSATVDATPITQTAVVSFNSGVSSSTSTVVASPVSVTDNGNASSTITVTVTDASGTPIPGQTVTLSQGTGGSLITAINAVTNNAGVATFKVTDSTSQEVTYSATVDATPITQTAVVSFNSGVSTTTSTVSASPTQVAANGTAFSTITVTVQDASGTPIPGQTVTLTPGSGSSLITAINAVTNNAGVATFKVTDSTSEVITYSATVDSVLLTSTATVTFGTGGVSATLSTVSASPVSVTDNGSASTTITVTVLNGGGDPVSGQTVTIGQGTGGSLITPVDGGITNAEGVATFTAVDSTSQEVIYSATVDSVPLTSTAVVSFNSGVSSSTSTVVASPVSVTDNGNASSTITVTVTDASGTPIPGQTVTLSQGTGGSLITAINAVTNNAGVATFKVTDSTSQEVTYSATVDATPITQTAVVSFNSGVSSSTSTVVASPVSVTDNGNASSTITVTVTDASGTPIPGQTVTLSQGTGGSLITAINAVTNNAGVATFKVTDSTSQEVTYSATVDATPITQTAVVSFNSGVSSSTSTVVASPVSVTDNGNASSTITVTVTDASGTPIPGQTVTLSQGTGGSLITAINAVTNNAGVATFKVTDSTSQEVTYSATVDATPITQTAVVSFNSGVSTTTSTVSASPTQVAANGTAFSTITVTVQDASGTPIPGQTVTLTPGSGSSLITAINAVTNNAGVATFKVTDSTSEVITYSATVDSVLLTSTATVTFGTGGVSATLSTVSASPVSVTDNGSASTTITVTVLNGGGDPVSGQTVTIGQGTGGSLITPVDGGITNAEGVATFTAVDSTSQEVIYSATVDSVPLTSTAVVSFNSGVSSSTSTVVASPVSVTDNGNASSTITVTVTDASGTPIPGQTVTLSQGTGGSLITAINAVTNNAGVATFKVTDSTSQEVTYSATVDATPITQTAVVSFNSGVSSSTSTVVASPVSVTDNGNASSTITVTVTDASGTPIPGQTVTLSQGTGGSLITAINAVTNNAGVATFKVTDSTSQEVTYSATVDATPITQTAVVSFNSGVSSSTSTVVASPVSVTDNGNASSTITVTVTDASGTPIPGQTVTLSQGTGGSLITAINAVTNNAGVATFKVTDSTSQEVTYSATVDATPITQTAVVSFNSGVSTTTSTVSASPTQVAANGTAFSTITVTVQDASGTPIPGQTVTLTPGSGSSLITAINAVTNNAGVATFKVTDSTSEVITYSATVDSVLLTSTATVTFGTGGVSATLSTVSASPVSVTDNGSASTTITVTVLNGGGDPVSGQTVTIGQGTGGSLITPVDGGITNAEGVATFTAVDSTSQEVIYSATVDSVPLTSTAVVSFNSGVSSSTSTVVASPVSVTDNGNASSTITVTVTDASGTPIPGQTVTLSQGTGGSLITAINAVTNNAGVATFKVTDSTSQEVTYSATVDATPITQTAVVSFNSGVSSSTSTVSASPTQVAANGTAFSTITVTVQDASGTPIPGQTVTLTPGSGSSLITAINAVTNNAGVATFKVTDSTSEVITYSATVDSVLLTSTATVTFGTGGVSATLSTVSASPVSVTDNGSASTTITVTVLNGGGDPVSGQTVTIGQGTGGSLITPVDGGITNAEGVATFTAVDSTSQEVIYSATVDSVPLTSTAVVSFNSGVSSSTSTVVASPVSVTDNGNASSTITVTVTDASGTPIPGQTVTLSQGTGGSLITAINAVTNNAGVATFKVTDSTSQEVTYSATVDATPITQTAVVSFNSGVSSSTSTVVASPVSVTDNGNASSTITVTVTDASGTPIPGQTVTLSQGTGGSLITAINAVTNNAGVATFKVTDSTSQEVTYSATVDATPITQTAVVSFNSGVSTTTSTVSASPTQVAANGTAFSTITVTVQDASGTPIPGQTVTLTPGSGSSLITAINAVTNNAGVATFKVTDSTSEVITYSAAVDSVLLTSTATVTFGTGGVSATLSTVSASPVSVTDNGSASTTITVTVLNGGGDPVSGQTVTIGQGTGGSLITPVDGGITNAEGVATFTAVDSTSQEVTYSATVDSVPLTSTAVVSFNSGVSSSTSTVVASPVSVTDNGNASSTITVTVTDASGTPIPGQTVTLSQGTGGSLITAINAVTNNAGVATFKVTDSTSQEVTYSATVDATPITQTAVVSFNSGVSTTTSTVSASPTQVAANGTAFSTITVTVQDASGTPIPGQTVTLTPGSGSSLITAINAVTNNAGVATFKVTDSTSEVITYSATVDSVLLTSTATVTFGTGGVSATLSTVSASPVSVTDNGSASTTITVTVLNGGGDPVSGQTVTIGQGTGGSLITPVDGGITNAEGVATFTAVDSTSQEVIYSATVDSVPLTSTAVVSFNSGVSSSTSTVVASPVSVTDNGNASSTITVTVTDASGTPIPGQTVTLSQGTGGSLITAINAVTNNAGVATFKVTDSTSQEVTYSATVDATPITQTAVVSFNSGVSTTTSTVSASPTQVAANGTAFSTITVTVQDASGTPIPGQTVTLTPGSGSSLITAINAVTNNAGVATFKVTDSTSEVITYSAAVDSVLLTSTATVTFGTGGVSQSNSSVTPSPTSVLDNGTTSTITVTVKNTAGTPLPGQMVTLVQSTGGHSTITTVVGTTNSAGQATFTVSDTTSQVVTYTATDTTAGVTLTNTGTVTFHGSVSATTSTVVASPTAVAANGSASSTITVTLEDVSGTPVSGQLVTLTQSAGGHSTITTLVGTTNSAGQATFKVVDSTNEVVTYSATDTTQSNLAITSTATVTFGTGGVSQSNSSVTPSPTSVLDNGTTSTITVTVKNTAGTPLPGQMVTLVQSTGGHSTITTVVGTTNSAGQATFTVSDTTSQVVTYTATDTTAGVTLTNTGTVTFHGSVSATTSTVVASPTAVAANGSASSTITVTLEDVSGTPVSGQLVTLTQSAGGHSTITTLVGTTNSAGQATFKVVDSTNEVVTYSATDTTQSNLAITSTATVTFGTGGVSQSNSSVTPSPTSVLDNGTTSTITVTVKNTAGTPLPGQMVTLVQSTGGHSTITTVVGTTNSAGQATFTVSDTTSQVVTYTATDTTAGVTLTNTGTVTFHGSVSATTSTVVASPTAVAANGSASSTITVTLEDVSGTPVSGQLVTLTQSAGGHSTITTLVGTTNSAGQATFKVVDSTNEVVTYSATDTTQSNLAITSTATVTFGTGGVSQSNSSVTPSPTSVLDNGTTSTITVTVKNTAGTPLPGQMVTLVQSTGGHSTITTVVGTTNSAGQATFTVSDTTSQVVTYTATDTTAGVTLTNTGTVTFHGSVSATTSTVVASPTAVAANGSASSTITVTLEDVSGTPVSGQLVTLTQSAGGHSTITTLVGTTNSAGQATFKVVDSTNEVVTYSATDTTQSNLAITSTATVTFGTGGVSQSNSSVTPSPTSVLDNGTTSTITVTVKNTAGTPLPGQMVTLVQSTGGHSTITTVVGTTNSAGQATFTVSDTTSQVVTYTATDTTAGVTLTNTGTVTFHGSVSATTSTVVASPTAVAANGSASSTITVTLEDVSGTPVAGQLVTLCQSSGGDSSIDGGAPGASATGVTNAKGQVTFTVTDTKAQAVTYTATDTTQSNLVVHETATVTYTAGRCSSSRSSVVASPTTVTANGTSTSTITVTLLDAEGNPVVGQTVTLSESAGGKAAIDRGAAGASVSGVTNAEGQVIFTVTDATAQCITFTATDTAASITLAVQVTFVTSRG